MTQEAVHEAIREATHEAIQEMIQEVIHEAIPEDLPLDDLQEIETIHHLTARSHGEEVIQEMTRTTNRREGGDETITTITVHLADAAGLPAWNTAQSPSQLAGVVSDGPGVTTTILTKTTIAAITGAQENTEVLKTTADHCPRDMTTTIFQIATLPDDGETRAEAAMMMTTTSTTDVTVETGTDGEIRAFPRR